MKIAIYPGTFDPITNGHLDIIERAANLFDELIVSVARNSEQEQVLFSYQERIELIQPSISNFPSVTIDSFEGLFINK